MEKDLHSDHKESVKHEKKHEIERDKIALSFDNQQCLIPTTGVSTRPILPNPMFQQSQLRFPYSYFPFYYPFYSTYPTSLRLNGPPVPSFVPPLHIIRELIENQSYGKNVFARDKDKLSSSNRRIKKEKGRVRVGGLYFLPSRGDWRCDTNSCLNWNFNHRTICVKCKKPKKVKNTKKDMKVDRKKKDKECDNIESQWPCSKCTFDNYSERVKCYKCGSPKIIEEKHIKSSSAVSQHVDK